MRHTATLALPCLLLGAGACATSTPPPGLASYSVGSGYSSGISDPPRRLDATGVHMVSGPQAGLVARADTLVMDARIEKEDPSASRALALAQEAAADLSTRLQQVAAGAATFTPCGTKLTPVVGKGKRTGPTEAFNIVIEGRIDVALAPDVDFWKRSALVVALGELTDRYENERMKTGKGVLLSGMHVIVKNPEGYRSKLTELWVQRARAFATAAQAHEAPLYLLDCATPGEITQQQRSIEEVALSLSVSCRLGSLKAAAATQVPVPAAR